MLTSYRIWADVLDNLKEGVVIRDAAGRIEIANSAASRMCGLSAADMQGMEAGDPRCAVVREDGSPLPLDIYPALVTLRTGEPQSGVVLGLQRQDGTMVVVSADTIPIVRDGRIEHVVSIFTDITDRRRALHAEEELRQRNRYIDTILEEAPIGFAVHTVDDGVGRFVTARFEEIYGVPRGAIDSHQTFFDKVWRHDPETGAHVKQRVVADMTSGDPALMHWDNVPIKVATGEIRYVNAMNIPLLDQNLMVSTVQDVTDRVRAEEARRKSEALYRLLAENVTDLIWILDVDEMRFRYVSPSVERILGYTAEEIVERGWIAELFMTDSAQAAVRRLHDRVKEFERRGHLEYSDMLELVRGDGSSVWVEFNARYVRSENGHVEVYGVSRDITERRRADTERQQLWNELSQAQKMESVGRLAGGIAHDFNNILADITAQLDLATRDYPAMRPLFDELRTDADLAATLIRQLLVFSRRSPLDRRLVDLNDAAARLQKMLGRLLGEDTVVQFEGIAGAASVWADPAMIEQVIMNLAVNARDAMPEGGSLKIAVTSVTLDADMARRRPRARAGQFVCLSVSDSGVGMDEKTLARAFEPFFTTKDPDKGTGLGLSMVHGIVAQHDGWVEAASAPGRGSTFTVFIPAAEETAVRAEQRAHGTVLVGAETILLVDDFERLREKMAESLKTLGYRVIQAGSSEQALRLWQEHQSSIDLLFSDISLPGGMNGLKLADTLRASNPALKVIFSSGYGEEMMDESRHAAGMIFLPKPCDLELMARTIRECFDRPATAVTGGGRS